jgi:hypothetical protein
MNTHADKTSRATSKANANGLPKLQRDARFTFQLSDSRSEAAAPTKPQELANNSPQVSRLRSLQQLAKTGPNRDKRPNCRSWQTQKFRRQFNNG